MMIPLIAAMVQGALPDPIRAAEPLEGEGGPENVVHPGHYGWLGDFHDTGGAYPAHFDRAHFRRHHITWFWLGDQWVVPYLLCDANRVREAIEEFKRGSRIWYEAFWWGDHSRWSEPGERSAFGAGSIPKPILERLAAQGIRPGGVNLTGRTWLDIARDPDLMAGAKKTIAWQLDTIFRACGRDALYGVVLSEEEPEVCLTFSGHGPEVREYFRANRGEVQEAMIRAMNELYDFVRGRYPWLKVAPGVYPQWVRSDLKRDAVVMDLYPNFGEEETAVRRWTEAWGTEVEHYILLWGYGDLDRRLECQRFDRVTGALMMRGFRNLGFFHPRLALEDRIYRLFDVHGAGMHAPFDAKEHAGYVRDLIEETRKVARGIEPFLGDRMPLRPEGMELEGATRSGRRLTAIADTCYGFRERILEEAYDLVRILKSSRDLSTAESLLRTEGLLPASRRPVTEIPPSRILDLEVLSKEYRSLPRFFEEAIPLACGLRQEAADLAERLISAPAPTLPAILGKEVQERLGRIAADLRKPDYRGACENALFLYT